ncbi:CPBP family intramembrane glutamic endopeptidase [Kordiimonas marina]|uniref:CPBP family intramembrane glutamic endopeptidase n=1 Tax=Kordiimonas marina TaxID=2872312 RepID=UPI001FF58954|nr:type II CAAX endopeptidase family protein [Kordiimonas marina]MCJ9429785.1 CPBP family intramembrane metalloprotease [Kordiimonas marina]
MSANGQTDTLPAGKVLVAVALFLALTALFSAGAYVLVLQLGLLRYYIALLMWAPGLAALLSCRVMGVKTASLGWRWGNPRWTVAGYLLPVIYGVIAYGLIWQLGLGGMGNTGFVVDLGRYLGLSGWSDGATLAFGIAILATVGMIWHVATALGEEIGWRGFLMPQLMRVMPFPLAALVTGLVWSLWHVPLIYYTTYNAGPVNLNLQMAYFTLLTVGLSFIMGYLRLRSGSLWPAAVLHAAHNALVLSILQPMTVQYADTWRYANEFGLVLPVVVASFGLVAWYRASKEGLTGPIRE